MLAWRDLNKRLHELYFSFKKCFNIFTGSTFMRGIVFNFYQVIKHENFFYVSMHACRNLSTYLQKIIMLYVLKLVG